MCSLKCHVNQGGNDPVETTCEAPNNKFCAHDEVAGIVKRSCAGDKHAAGGGTITAKIGCHIMEIFKVTSCFCNTDNCNHECKSHCESEQDPTNGPPMAETSAPAAPTNDSLVTEATTPAAKARRRATKECKAECKAPEPGKPGEENTEKPGQSDKPGDKGDSTTGGSQQIANTFQGFFASLTVAIIVTSINID